MEVQALEAKALKAFSLQYRCQEVQVIKISDKTAGRRLKPYHSLKINSFNTCSKMSGHPLLTISSRSTLYL